MLGGGKCILRSSFAHPKEVNVCKFGTFTYVAFERRRRTPFFYANPRFWRSQQHADEDDDDNELEEQDEGDLRGQSPF
jgi:hypothetical protein